MRKLINIVNLNKKHVGDVTKKKCMDHCFYYEIGIESSWCYIHPLFSDSCKMFASISDSNKKQDSNDGIVCKI